MAILKQLAAIYLTKLRFFQINSYCLVKLFLIISISKSLKLNPKFFTPSKFLLSG